MHLSIKQPPAFLSFVPQNRRYWGTSRSQWALCRRENLDPEGRATFQVTHVLNGSGEKGAEVGSISRLMPAKCSTISPSEVTRLRGSGLSFLLVLRTLSTIHLRDHLSSLAFNLSLYLLQQNPHQTPPLHMPRSNELPLTRARPLLCLLRAKLLSRVVHPWTPLHPLLSFPSVQHPGL